MNPNLNFLDPLCPWGRYFAALDLALAIAEARHGFPGKAVQARTRLIAIAVGGNSGFVNVPAPEVAAEAYCNHVYMPALHDLPENIQFAERGY